MGDEKELKDQRIPIMMTESEVTAIDDWAFKHRIRSRGEAIRRLCQLGILLDETSRDAKQAIDVVENIVIELGQCLHFENDDNAVSKAAFEYMQNIAGGNIDTKSTYNVAQKFIELLKKTQKLRMIGNEISDYSFFSKGDGNINELIKDIQFFKEIYSSIKRST